jgi:hypothetical protein
MAQLNKGDEFTAGGNVFISDGRGGGRRKRATPKKGLRQGLGESGASRNLKKGNTFKKKAKKKVVGVGAGAGRLAQKLEQRKKDFENIKKQL